MVTHAVLSVITIWISSRYLFVLPMLGIGRGFHPNLISECVDLSKRARWATVLIAAVELAPTAVFFAAADIPKHSISAALVTAASLLGTVFSNCLSTWLVLVATSLLIQVMKDAPPAEINGYPNLDPQPEL